MKPRFAALIFCLAVAGCASSPGAMTREGGVVHPQENVGLVERLAAGNIDQAGSQAYLRWGAGYDAWVRASDRKFGVR